MASGELESQIRLLLQAGDAVFLARDRDLEVEAPVLHPGVDLGLRFRLPRVAVVEVAQHSLYDGAVFIAADIQERDDWLVLNELLDMSASRGRRDTHGENLGVVRLAAQHHLVALHLAAAVGDDDVGEELALEEAVAGQLLGMANE